ncbi:odorant receptor coreceptor isoform X2 [Anopheles albimanus]|uniref:Odorant receptor coreceptor n=2 Tax=Anopheles albimanus TaxID=7167 RepID=A0A182FNW6_ANOAL|nr:odorant receptor coreceptor isoform X2 [Anopheles albimanus]XP_035775221.1 odorant receptor coreceptor isoform X2 [Anopheles albimanus]
MQVQPSKYVGLVADLMPNIRLMQASGHFLFRYVTGPILIRKLYSWWTLIMVLLQFFAILANLATNTDDVNELTANTITTLFFTHSVTKFIYFAVNSENFYRTLGVWNQTNTHPLFAESDARYHSIALAKMRKLLVLVMATTVLSVVAWVTITFFGESVKNVLDKETNETYTVEIPRLPIKSWYPWNAMSGPAYIFSFIYQTYYLLFSMVQSNLVDVMFCSWLLLACEQLQHLKGIMRPLMELSASLDTYRPNSAALFRAISAGSKSELILNEEKEPEPVKDFDLSGIYSSKADWGAQFRAPTTLQTFDENGRNGNPNGLSRNQEMMVRSAIKYWVERHKHVVRLVTAIGDTYGPALLLHMLTSTIKLTLLAYQATKIDGVNVYGLTVIGYLCYALAQVFLFCIFGNRLIEESSSVMEAAYSCHWYDGSEEAKTFVQIVCQQCQKAMTISGAKFFTVSLDLFASVLGAVVTYFMVLVQLK